MSRSWIASYFHITGRNTFGELRNTKCISSKEQNSNTYNISAAEKSGLLKLIPALHLVKEDEAVLKPISPPRAKSLLPIAAESSKRGEGFKPILELMAAC